MPFILEGKNSTLIFLLNLLPVSFEKLSFGIFTAVSVNDIIFCVVI